MRIQTHSKVLLLPLINLMGAPLYSSYFLIEIIHRGFIQKLIHQLTQNY